MALARMVRPDHLLLVSVVYLLGVVMAVARGTAWDARAVVVGLAVGITASASIHLANEWSDVESDGLTRRTRFSGGSGAIAELDVPPSLAAMAAVTTLVLAAVLGVAAWLAGLLTGAALVLVGVAAGLGWAYSVPPVALARRGWGEVDNALLGGLLLPHYGFAVLTEPNVIACLAVLPFTLVVLANLLATQWPDRWADAAVGAFTLATRWTAGRLRMVHAASLAMAFALIAAMGSSILPRPVALASWLALPPALWAVITFTRDDNPLPTVATMVVLVAAQLTAWVVVVGGPTAVVTA